MAASTSYPSTSTSATEVDSSIEPDTDSDTETSTPVVSLLDSPTAGETRKTKPATKRQAKVQRFSIFAKSTC